MSISIPRLPRPEIVYPDSDGKPMAENTLQFRWIVTIKRRDGVGLSRTHRRFRGGGLALVSGRRTAGNLCCPDTLVTIGRPKGYRGSYKQWEEGGIAPQVVFEILSPNNRDPEMERKLEFYDSHGVQEYYVYDPDDVELIGRRRAGGDLKRIRSMKNWTSPILKVRFDMSGSELQLFGPDGSRFETYQEIAEKSVRLARENEQAERQREQAERQREQAERQREQAERQREQAERQREQAERQREQAERQREETVLERDAERQRAERMAAQLRAIGIEPAE